MISIFHGDNAKTHKNYQAWRKANVDGFLLSQSTDGQFTVHYSQDKRENSAGRGCMHNGGSGIEYLEYGCRTAAKKVCSNSLAELIAWATEQGFTTKNCKHCDSKRFPFPPSLFHGVASPSEASKALEVPGSVIPHAATAYVFLWNPKKDTESFEDYDQVQKNAASGRSYTTRWICRSKKPRAGDLAIVQRTGNTNNGVFATGHITRAPFDDSGTRFVGLKLDSFLPIGSEISRKEIVKAANYNKKKWSPMASGDIIPDQILHAIQSLWSKPSEVSKTLEVPGSVTHETDGDEPYEVFPQVQILIGDAGYRKQQLEELATTGRPAFWYAPKLTAAGDTVMFYIEEPVSAIVAVGEALSPARATSRKWYEAKVGKVRLLKTPITLAELRAMFPDWAWLRSVNMFSYVSSERAKALMKRCALKSGAVKSGTKLRKPGQKESREDDPIKDVERLKALMGFRALKKTEQEAVIKSRIGQGMFRGGVELLWNRRCAVTGVRAINLLVASHIKPWKKSTNRQKLNPYNGLLLVPNLDKAFDKGMISFDDGGHIIVSARLSEEDAAILGITKRLKLCKVSAETKKYLRYHRRHVYLGGVR